MKIIFSRKGFDDAYGGGASPILPDGTLLSIPIPARNGEAGISYSALYTDHEDLEMLMHGLGLSAKDRHAHVDPDLRPKLWSTPSDWKAAFGQHGAACSHLKSEGVEIGDLFLFFGTFKRTYRDRDGLLRFEADYPRHILFGYLLIGDIIDVGQRLNITGSQQASVVDAAISSLSYHPHVMNDYGPHNLIYVAADEDLDGQPAFGSFDYGEELVLTRRGFRKSIWDLPACFHPDSGCRMSRHRKQKRFAKRDGRTIVQTVGIGQEFVVTHSEDAVNWARQLIREATVR